MPKQEYWVPMVAHAMKILDELADSKEATFTEIVNRCNSNKASTKRILITLLAEGALEYDSTTRFYRLGTKVYKWGQVVAEFFDLRIIGRKVLKKLRDETSETVAIYEKRQHQQVCVEKIESLEKMRIVSEIGTTLPLTYGPGKVILAHLEPGEIETCLVEPIPIYTARTIVNKKELYEQLDEIRRIGYFVDKEEYIYGVIGIAVPLFNCSNNVIGALSLVAPLHRMGDENKLQKTLKQVIKAGKEISKQLGYP